MVQIGTSFRAKLLWLVRMSYISYGSLLGLVEEERA